jgi:hypothetical protein
MKETLEAEKARLTDAIKLHDDRHQESMKLANIFRKQLKQIERAIAAYEKPTQADVIKQVSEGLIQDEMDLNEILDHQITAVVKNGLDPFVHSYVDQAGKITPVTQEYIHKVVIKIGQEKSI